LVRHSNFQWKNFGGKNVFLEVVAKLLHQNLDFVDKSLFWSETSSKPGFDSSTRFFQGFG